MGDLTRCLREHRGLGGYCDAGEAEGGQVVGLARGDDVVVDDHFGVFPDGAGVNDIVFDREEGSGALAFQHVRGAEHPGSVADGGCQLALLGDVADELDGFGMAADEVGRKAAGCDDAVEVFGAGGIVRDIGLTGVAELAGIAFAGGRAGTRLPFPGTSDRRG